MDCLHICYLITTFSYKCYLDIQQGYYYKSYLVTKSHYLIIDSYSFGPVWTQNYSKMAQTTFAVKVLTFFLIVPSRRNCYTNFINWVTPDPLVWL